MGCLGFGNKLLDGIDLFVDINYRTEIDVYVKKGALVDKRERGNSSLYCVIVGSTKVQEL